LRGAGRYISSWFSQRVRQASGQLIASTRKPNRYGESLAGLLTGLPSML